jgi:hypothetical protein
LHRSYIEVKRENEGEHKRSLSIQAASNEILGCLEPLYHWLKPELCTKPCSADGAADPRSVIPA